MYAVALSGFRKLNLGPWGLPVKGGGSKREYLQLGKVRGLCAFCPLPLPCTVEVRGLQDLTEVGEEGGEKIEGITEREVKEERKKKREKEREKECKDKDLLVEKE